jgi:hypothetical protein
VKKPELFNEGGRIIGPRRGDAFEQRGAGDQVLRPGAPMQLVLQRMFDLPFQVRGNVVPMGDVANAGQRFGPPKGLSGRGQPRINPSSDAGIVGRSQPGQLLLNSEGDAGMMRGTEMPPVLDTGNLARAQESQVDGDIHQLLRREQRVFPGQKPEHQIQFLTPTSAAFVARHQSKDKLFLARGESGFGTVIVDLNHSPVTPRRSAGVFAPGTCRISTLFI